MSTLTADDILKLLHELNEKLREEDIHGEMYVFGGAVMAIEYNARLSTRDIDAVFEPKKRIYDIARNISEERGIDTDWLNDGVKGFVSPLGEKKVLIALTNLTIWSPSAEYLLAMKCLSARAERDFGDIKVLMRATGLLKTQDVMNTVEKYYPAERLKINTEYLIMEAEQEIGKEDAARDDDKGLDSPRKNR